MGGVRDGNAVRPGAVKILADNTIRDEQELLALHAKVHSDGNEAQLMLHTSLGSIPLTVMHEQLSVIIAELQAAAALMLYRQSMQADDGKACFDDVFAAALRPQGTFVTIDQATSDRMFMLQFRDRLPLAIRMTPEQVADSLDQLGTVSRLSAN